MNLKKNISEEDAHSATINVTKRKMYDKKIYVTKINKTKRIQKITQKPFEEIIKKYLLPDRPSLPINTFKSKELLLSYRLFINKLEKERFEHHLKVKNCENYKIISTDLQKRLYTEDSSSEYPAIIDVDPDFFSCMKRSLLTRFVPPFKSFQHLFSSQMRLRQEVGYRKDCILNIAYNNRKEQIVFDESIQRYKKQIKHFDDFIQYDYQKSMLFLSKWDEIKAKVINKTSELQNLAMEKLTITSRIESLEYRYGLQQKYGRFLYYLSPPSWRSQNRNFAQSIEIEAKGFDFRTPNDDDSFNVTFEKLQKECYKGLVKPVLYFTNPGDLMEIFNSIEKQQLYHFTQVTKLAPLAKSLKHSIKYIKDLISLECTGIFNTVREFQKFLEFCEDRSNQIEAKFFKIINGTFYDNVGAFDVLKFQQHLEYCYEKLCNEKPVNMDIVAIGKAIEHIYMDYSKKLDAVTSEEIKQALNQCIQSERRKFKKAKKAAREMRRFERLERELLRVYGPVAGKKTVLSQKDNHSLFPKHCSKPKIAEKNRKSLSEETKEYLILFTDWNEKDDPLDYLSRLTMPTDKIKSHDV